MENGIGTDALAANPASRFGVWKNSFIKYFHSTKIEFRHVFEKELVKIRERRGKDEKESLPTFENKEGALKEALCLDERDNQGGNWNTATENDKKALNLINTSPREEERRKNEQKVAFFHSGLTGLALSGGGIRSATFNLGVLQGLDNLKIFHKLDYLSSVSGGGYTACCLSSLYATGQKNFPFCHQYGQVENQRFKHLREYSNYLAPHGILDQLRMPALFLRGLFLNFLLILPFILAAAGAYVWLLKGAPSIELSLRDFFLTKWLLVFLTTLFLAYILVKRINGLMKDRGVKWLLRENATRFLGLILLLVLVAAFIEIQPYAIDFYKWLGNQRRLLTGEISWGDVIGGVATLVGATAAFITAKGSTSSRVAKKKIYVFLAGILGPFVFWLLFIVLAKWALYEDGRLIIGGQVVSWLLQLHGWLFGLFGLNIDSNNTSTISIAHAYITTSVVLFMIGWFINVNDYSLHGFYRDRLSKAYLMGHEEDYQPPKHNDKQLLSTIGNNSQMPYHIINTALNVPTPEKDTSDQCLRSPGRTAESFFFTQDFAGSDTTGYCETHLLEKSDPWFNLGTAMAISGAAFSPNMGNTTAKPLAFVLAMLNVRLGYWILNPRLIKSWTRVARFRIPGRWLLFKEMLSIMNASDHYINLSDGGHMDNLGIYELLRRRCRLIIASDAEADPNYQMEGLATVCRLAQIDMGIGVEFNKKDLEDIRKGKQHYAIGTIHYTDKVKGRIIYLKASISRTGESAYIDRYKKLNPDFPHETTMDQFYDEEQFECYRALGYNIAKKVFTSPC